MKLEIVQEYALTKDKPMCGTCMFRGNVSIAHDPSINVPQGSTVLPKHVTITGVQCEHPLTVDETVEWESICNQYSPVNDTLARLFATRRII